MNRYKITMACLFVAIVCMSIYFIKKPVISGHKKVGPQPDGSVLVPSNQLLRPAGLQVFLPGRPVDLALTPNDRLLLVKNQGSLDLIRVNDRTILQSLPYPHGGASYTGICISADGRRVFVTDAANHIDVAALDTDQIMHWQRSIVLPKPSIGGDAFPGGLLLNETGDKIYVALSRNNTLAVVNLNDTSTITQIPTGIAPYDIVMASSHKVYVSNWGGRRPGKEESSYPSSGSRVSVDPKTGIANSGTISVINLDSGVEERSINVGLHPAGMVLSPAHDKLYVACANSDVISVIDTKTDLVTDTISVHAQRDIPFGSAPNALAISADGEYLYVANGTENAVCVIQTAGRGQVLGYIPTGWYPGSVVLNKTGKFLYVANVKGIGSRSQKPGKSGFNSHDALGTVSIIPMPDKEELAKMTNLVHENNSYFQMLAKLHAAGHNNKKVPVPVLPGQTSRFKHVVYIIKENRTYDGVLGDMTQGNGDSSLTEFGREVSPNHHHLAEEFVLMDDYNCSGVLSADGHQWTDEAYVTDYLEKSFGDFTRSYPYDGDDPLAYASSG
ncbi:MAG: YncE family protein, partial [Bacteroidota bacterium]|nr:YncE family protein [Bacteroidota bacterium]